jgi:hypothetical protein
LENKCLETRVNIKTTKLWKLGSVNLGLWLVILPVTSLIEVFTIPLTVKLAQGSITLDWKVLEFFQHKLVNEGKLMIIETMRK